MVARSIGRERPAATPRPGVAVAVDGRTARRDRNRVAVLDAVLALFSEDHLEPSPEKVAQRSGVSLRSVYRYFADTEGLLRAAIDRQLEVVEPLLRIHAIGEGGRADRIERFVAARVRLYEAVAPAARAARLRAPANHIVREQVEWTRRGLRAQLERHFAPELRGLDPRDRRAVVAAADACCQLEALDLYRRHRGFSARETGHVLRVALDALIPPGGDRT